LASIANVLIVGGGIAGTTLAISLQRKGIQVEIVEFDPDWTVLGVGISLQGPALRALKTIGVLDRCVQEGFGYSKRVVGNAECKITNVVNLPRLCGPDYPATIGIMRPALHNILSHTATETGAVVRLGLTISLVKQIPRAVEVEFADGTCGIYDFVVGADGIHSKVRELVFGKVLKPAPTGQAVWRAMVDRPPEVDTHCSFYCPRNKAGFNPVSRKEMYVFLTQNITDNVRLPTHRLPAVMRQLLADFGGLMAEARERITRPEQIVCRPIESFILPAPWYRGRVLVVGDAAHPTTPHLASGAGLAIEDTIVLTELLCSDATLREALEEFMARRYERCRMVV
jgi:2-polyprenyl-6-methoxyphenol hydroxylase-like FAD-dependent oxidoreductase